MGVEEEVSFVQVGEKKKNRNTLKET